MQTTFDIYNKQRAVFTAPKPVRKRRVSLGECVPDIQYSELKK